jgi:DDE superfamily endonuclease
MARTRGRCPRGQRLRAAVPHGHWKTSAFVAALRNDGITAPFVIDGAINGIVFRTYVETVLAPALADGDIVVVMDNLGSHKVAGVREAIDARGVSLVYLASLFARFQSDRTGLRQAQGTPQSRRRSHR